MVEYVIQIKSGITLDVNKSVKIQSNFMYEIWLCSEP